MNNKLIIVSLVFTLFFSNAKSTFSRPSPTFENPRKIVIQMFDSDLKKVNNNISAIYNILKEYPSESVKIVIIAYGNGMRAFKKDYDSKTLRRIRSILEYDVEIIGCRNTMRTMHWKDNDFIDGLTFVQAGIVELVEKKIGGYASIIAY